MIACCYGQRHFVSTHSLIHVLALSELSPSQFLPIDLHFVDRDLLSYNRHTRPIQVVGGQEVQQYLVQWLCVLHNAAVRTFAALDVRSLIAAT